MWYNLGMSMTAERGFTPPSGADLTPVEFTNPLIRGYLILKPGIDRIAGFRNRVTATLVDTFSQPLTAPSSPLRIEEFPTQDDKDAAVEAALNPERSLLPKWALRFAISGTGLFAIACNSTIPQELNKPAIIEPAKPAATATPGGVEAAGLTPTATVVAQEAQKTPTPEAKAEFCGFLPAEYSNLLRPNYGEYSNGEKKLTGLVARVPIGVPVIARQAGKAAKIKTSEIRTTITISNPDDPTMTTQIISGRIRANNMLEEDVIVGEELGYVESEPENPNDINFSTTYSKYDPSTKAFSLPTELLEQGCPGVLSRDPRIVKVDFLPENAPQTTSITNTYRN